MNEMKSPPNLPQVAALIRATPQMLRVELRALGDKGMRWHPTPEMWCINQVIGHLIEADRYGFAGRIQTILAQDRPLLAPWDIKGVAVRRRDCKKYGFDLIDELAAMREESARVIVGLGPEQLKRVGRHPQIGELQVAELIHEWVHHDRNHVKQILSNIQAFVWPDMGATQRFSEPM